MKEILLTIGMGLAGLLGVEVGDVNNQPENEVTVVEAVEMNELDEKLWYARQASSEGDYDESLRLFEELESLDEGRYYWAAISGQTNIYRRQYNIEEAKAVADRAGKKFPEAVGLTHVWKGDMEMQRNNPKKAIEEYQIAEENYGQTIVNEMVMGEVALKQAARAAIKDKDPSKAAQFARKMADNYPQVGNPEAALARSLLYEAMAAGEMEVDTLENVLEGGGCSLESPCFVAADKKIKKKDQVDKSRFKKLDNFSEFQFELEEKDEESLEKIKKVKEGDNSILESLIPGAEAQTISFTTCSVATESAYQGFYDPIEDITRGDLFMTYPAAADGTSYHPGVDLNNWYDHVGSDTTDCSNSPADRFIATAAGCVQESSLADWGSLTITHKYLPYNLSYTEDYITSQYGHADELYVSVGDAVGTNEEVGSVGGIGSDSDGDGLGDAVWDCHLHFELREPDHPDPYNAAYWSSSVFTQDNVGLYYTDPESFIDSHPAFDWEMWVDESSTMWTYTGTWTYLDTKGNGNTEDENDLNYTSTTSSSSADATATFTFTPSYTGSHNFYIFAPWSSGTKSDSVPVTIRTSDGSSTLLSDTIDFYGTTTSGEGTCDVGYDSTGDGYVDSYYFGSSKRCDEWFEISSEYLTAGVEYEMEIENNTGSSSDIIIIDDILITYGSGTAAKLGKASVGGGDGEATADVCAVPSSGDWTVSTDCSLESDDTAPGNVEIDDGITLTISSGVTLDMDLSSYHINIGNGSRLIIEEGAKVD